MESARKWKEHTAT
jgi:hypothetical protein